MSNRRDRLLLVAGAVSVAAGAWLLFAPGTVPALGPLDALTDLDTAAQAGLLVGLVVAALAAFQMRRTARATLDRSDLVGSPPEQARDTPVPVPSAPLAESYRRLGGHIERLGRTGWHVAAYGRRARDTTDLSEDRNGPRDSPAGRPPDGFLQRPPVSPPPQTPDGQPRRAPDGSTRQTAEDSTEQSPDGSPRRPAEEAPPQQPPEKVPRQRPPEGPQRPPDGPPAVDRAEQERGQGRAGGGYRGFEAFRRQTREELLALLDEMAVTARDTYATATGCEAATAERAVQTGTWTDDRVAAAFLATDHDAPTFTVTERALAWLTPRRTLDRRLGRTLDAIETDAESFLTYPNPSVGGTDTAERADSRTPEDPPVDRRDPEEPSSAGPEPGQATGDGADGAHERQGVAAGVSPDSGQTGGES